MRLHREPALWALLLGLCFLTAAAFGQEAVTAADVRSALEDLKEAPGHERTEKWEAVVKLGDVAADALIAEVEGHQQTEDASYVGWCMLALAELKAERATDALIGVLGSSNMQLVYQAASVLGTVWEGKRGTDEKAKQVNAALLGSLYSDAPSAAYLGPALSLVKVNGIPVSRPESMKADDLSAEIDRWMAANPAALPAVDQRPWQLNLRMARTSSDPAVQQSAIQAIRQKRELGPVEAILDALAEEASLPDAVRTELAGLLGELTGVPFPPQGADGPADEQILRWKRLWVQVLKAKTDRKHMAYAWRELESSLRRYDDSPSEATAKQVRDFRAVVIYQLPDPDAIPGGASARAKKLLSKPLEIKKRISAAMTALERQAMASEKLSQLKIIDAQVSQEGGQEIGVLFLGGLAALAGPEVNQPVLRQIGDLLSTISGIPCDVSSIRPEKRRSDLEKWAETVRKIGLPLEIPAA